MSSDSEVKKKKLLDPEIIALFLGKVLIHSGLTYKIMGDQSRVLFLQTAILLCLTVDHAKAENYR